MPFFDKKQYIILQDIAEMFQEDYSIKDIQKKLVKITEYRKKITNVDFSDLECKIAAEIVKKENITDSAVINYIDVNTRKHIQNEKTKTPNFTGNIQPSNGRPFMLNPKRSKLKKPIGKGTCGGCWMCGLPVNFYYDKKDVTNCGECEHIGGIVASLLAGMLMSSMSSERHYNYGTSHVHCNGQKSSMISMKFDNDYNEWEYDEDGTDAIVNAICSDYINGNENDPEFVEKFYLLKTNKKVVKQNIKSYTEDVWCPAANYLIDQFDGNTIDVSKRTLTIIMWIESRFDDFKEEKNEYKKIITHSVDDDDNENYYSDDDYYGGEPSPEKKASPKKYTYRPEETFGIKISNAEEAQKILNELKTEPKFKELLNNLIIAIDEKLRMTSPSPKKMSTSPKKASPSPKKMSTSPKKASPSQNYSIKSIKNINNLVLKPETQHLFTQFLPVKDVDNFRESIKRSRSPSNNNNKEHTNKKTRAGSKNTKNQKTRKYRRKPLS